MKTKANITPAVANSAKLLKFDLPTLQVAYDALCQEAKQDMAELKSVTTGVKRVLELRLSIAVTKVGGLEKYATVQSLAEALLRTTVCDGVGLPYDEILHLVLAKFSDATTTMNCIRWYASRLQKGENAEVLPPRPSSTSVAAA